MHLERARISVPFIFTGRCEISFPVEGVDMEDFVKKALEEAEDCGFGVIEGKHFTLTPDCDYGRIEYCTVDEYTIDETGCEMTDDEVGEFDLI